MDHGSRHEGEDMTAFTMRKIRNEIIESCAIRAEATALNFVNGEAQTKYGKAYQSGCHNAANHIRAMKDL
jgi:hypothetical protein